MNPDAARSSDRKPQQPPAEPQEGDGPVKPKVLPKGYQRRPDLTTRDSGMSAALITSMNYFVAFGTEHHAADTNVSRLTAVVTDLVSADTPDARLRCLSRLNEAANACSAISDVATMFVSHVGGPVLFSPEMRYLHKGLLNVLRNQLLDVSRVTLPTVYMEYLATSHEALLKMRTAAPTAEEAIIPAEASSVINTLDTVSVLLAPAFVVQFASLTIPALPLLRLLFQHALGCVRLDADSEADVHAVALDHLRFVVRTVTTILHKFIDVVVRHLEATSTTTDEKNAVADVFGCAAAMLSIPRLPKDLLNAAGLLVATALSLRTPRGVSLQDLLASVARQCNASLDGGDDSALTATPSATVCASFRSFLCAAYPLGDDGNAVGGGHDAVAALASSLGSLSCNGALALYKGLMSHIATDREMQRDASRALTLIAGPNYVLYDLLTPVTAKWTSRTDRPETRFVAVQTLDAAVRHVVNVLRTASGLPVDSEEVRALCAEAHVSRVTALLNLATDTVLCMWDDPTQHVAGPLYDTYELSLQAFDELRALQNRSTRDTTAVAAPSTGEAAVHRALELSDDRRGKFQTLCALIPRVEVGAFVAAVAANCNRRSPKAGATDEALFASDFMPQLLTAATNSKVSNLVGDVICVLCKRILGDAVQHANSGVKVTELPAHEERWVRWNQLCMDAIVDGCLARRAATNALSAASVASRGERGVPSSLIDRDDASRRLLSTNVVTHVILPLLRHGGSPMLRRLLSALVAKVPPGTQDSMTCLAVVQIINRARGAGLDIGTYLERGADAADVVTRVRLLLRHALHVADNDLRLTALELICVDAKAAAPVTADQSETLRDFLNDNLSLGGDSTFRNRLLTVVGKWCARAHMSLTSTKARNENTAAAAAGGPSASAAHFEEYVDRVYDAARNIIKDMWANHYLGEYSVNRKFAALRVVEIVLGTIVPLYLEIPAAASPYSCVLRGRSNASAVDFIPDCVPPSLLVGLDEGWDQLRGVAMHVLDFAAALRPSLVATHLMDTSVIASRLRASQLRRSEGGALRAMSLMQHLVGAAGSASIDLGDGLSIVLQGNRAADVNAQQAALTACGAVTKALSRMEGTVGIETWSIFIAAPVHGLLTLLCEALKRVDGSTSGGKKVVSEAVAVCAAVLTWCGTLVGRRASDLPDAQGTNVDCRGHVYGAAVDKTFEKRLRIVVNNSWLGIRMATATLQQILRMVKLPDTVALPPHLAERVGRALITTLLNSKHNGVIAKCRWALRDLTAALLAAPSTVYTAIPKSFMRELLFGDEGVQSSDAGRMLRRSQGLPHAVLPMLDAEDPSLPPTLVPLALNHLICVAKGATDAASARATHQVAGTAEGEEGLGDKDELVLHGVNALNILKFVFDDSRLSSRVSPFLEPALLTAAGGFRHRDWFVRNSSLMLFTSAVRRVVGDHPVKGGCGVSSTLGDLARRLPLGSVFIAERLASTAATSATSKQLQPEVYPLLLLLSLLRPDGVHTVGQVLLESADGASSSSSVSELGVLLQRVLAAVAVCTSLDGLMIRFAAANAFASLVPPELVSTAVASRVNAAGQSLNHLHGALAVCHRILRAYVGWEHDGTSHARALEALRVRESPAHSHSVLLSVTAAAIDLADLVLSKTLVPCILELWLNLVADVLYAHDASCAASPDPQVATLARRALAAASHVSSRLEGEDGRGLRAGADDLANAACRVLIAASCALRRPTIEGPLPENLLFTAALATALHQSRCSAAREYLRSTGVAERSVHVLANPATGLLRSRASLASSIALSEGAEALLCVVVDRQRLDVVDGGRLDTAMLSGVCFDLFRPTETARATTTSTLLRNYDLLSQCVAVMAECSDLLGRLHDTIRVIMDCSTPTAALALRFAAASALETVANRCRDILFSGSAASSSGAVRVDFGFACLRLCLDDDAAVRRQAGRCSLWIESHAAHHERSDAAAPVDCVRRIVEYIRATALSAGIAITVVATAERTIQELCGYDALEAADDNDGTESDDGDDDGAGGAAGDDTLFEVEGDNMYAEASTLRQWLRPIQVLSTGGA